jgi:hypothetical protein
MLQTDTLELAILTELARVGACTLDELNERLLSCSWNQVFAAVDRLSREGGVILQRPDSSDYLLSLAHQRAEGTPRDAGRIPGEHMTPRVHAIQGTSMLLVARSHPTASSVS